jgi:caa(3)-type oxidase subunit IV
MKSGIEAHSSDQPSTRLYLTLWGILLVLLGVSIALGKIGDPWVRNTLVFSVAAVKVVLVVRYFMGVRFEPWLIVAILLIPAIFLAILFIGVAPDVSIRTGWGQH